jgi:hypothetical protein
VAGELDEAQALYEELLKKNPSWRVGYDGSLGAVAARKGERPAAEAYLDALATVQVPAEAQPSRRGRSRRTRSRRRCACRSRHPRPTFAPARPVSTRLRS